MVLEYTGDYAVPVLRLTVAVAFKRYASAPITEAVIEIRVQPPDTLHDTALRGIADSLKSEFPKQVPMRLLQVGLAAPQPNIVSQHLSQSDVGFRLEKLDEARILQIRRDGFSYSHMPPYSEWSSFRAEARPLWDRYRSVVTKAQPARCALRYINRIDIPHTRIEIFDYFTLYPHVPDELPQRDIASMAMNLQFPQTDIGCMVTVNQAGVEPGKPNHLSIVLDIDIFRLGIEAWSDDEVWDFLDVLRVRKNEIFEACITDRTRELIDK